MKGKDAKENAKDRREKGESREPAARIFMNELKPDEICDEGNDDRLSTVRIITMATALASK